MLYFSFSVVTLKSALAAHNKTKFLCCNVTNPPPGLYKIRLDPWGPETPPKKASWATSHTCSLPPAHCSQGMPGQTLQSVCNAAGFATLRGNNLWCNASGRKDEHGPNKENLSRFERDANLPSKFDTPEVQCNVTLPSCQSL